MSGPTKKAVVRVLTLPGYTQNAKILEKKMGSVRKTSKQVDWVFLDPPHILDKVDFGNGTATIADFDSESSLDKEQRTPETTPRAWFTASHDHSDPNKVKTTYNMMDETIAYLHDFLVQQEEPFDGVFGFSQGACMAALLAALMEKPALHPKFPAHPKLKPLKSYITSFTEGGEQGDVPPPSSFGPQSTDTSAAGTRQGTPDTIENAGLKAQSSL
ncbi:hypothetical protein QFC22_002147 [Naganishia vaughanmartiniae]|uniref:Uncharacterized protein n=1 Tax=Naganishia vaughanmartiniae TaxID=1424756 RepID=A0ACC2XDT3_9TREE|nr:hypothetical protein QFC22_002147 [Naganishia vaughanmartiniae]